MFNAFLFAFFYSVLSRCENRSSQLVFSKKLCIGTRGEKVFAWSRCYDIDASYPVVEPHVRMYVMDNKMQMHVLRIQQPNDDTGGMLYTSLPVEVHHHIDNHSVLSPRQMPLVEDSHGLVLRTADSLTANREEIVCPVCGEAYGTYERLWKHIQYNRVVEERDDYPHESSHLGFAMPDITPISLEEVKTHFEQHISEIVVVVEGIDPQVSGTFQSLQSYKYEDIAWAGEFEPCLSVRSNKFCVDFAKFHEVRLPDQSNSSNIEEKDVEAAAANNSGDEAEEVIENGEHHDLAC